MKNRVAGVQPAQDLAGVRTWVEKGNQDGSQKDKSAPEKSRPDYADGKPQRDRVLPLPSGHPKGRDEERAGPPVMNTPSDSSGASTSYSKAMNPNAIPNQPQGKPLHQRPRSSGVPGDEYGHPFIDQSTSTGLKRRVASDEIIEELEDGYYDLDDEGNLVVAEISVRPPRRRQRKQQGDLEHKYRRRRQRAYRRNRGKRKMQRKRYYRRNKNRIKRYMKRYRKSPQLFKRLEGGGVSTTRQRNQKSRKASLIERLADRFMETLSSEELDIISEELLAIPSKGPGSRSRPKQKKLRRRNKMRGDRNRLRRERRKYYRRNKVKEKRRSKMWRKKYRSRLKSMRRRASIGGNMKALVGKLFPHVMEAFPSIKELTIIKIFLSLMNQRDLDSYDVKPIENDEGETFGVSSSIGLFSEVRKLRWDRAVAAHFRGSKKDIDTVAGMLAAAQIFNKKVAPNSKDWDKLGENLFELYFNSLKTDELHDLVGEPSYYVEEAIDPETQKVDYTKDDLEVTITESMTVGGFSLSFNVKIEAYYPNLSVNTDEDKVKGIRRLNEYQRNRGLLASRVASKAVSMKTARFYQTKNAQELFRVGFPSVAERVSRTDIEYVMSTIGASAKIKVKAPKPRSSEGHSVIAGISFKKAAKDVASEYSKVPEELVLQDFMTLTDRLDKDDIQELFTVMVAAQNGGGYNMDSLLIVGNDDIEVPLERSSPYKGEDGFNTVWGTPVGIGGAKRDNMSLTKSNIVIRGWVSYEYTGD